ncbi:hypothetical protein EJ640_19370, partial [Pseudomonas aeruginosa]
MGDEAGSGSGRHAGFRGSQGIEGALPRAGTRLPLAKPHAGRGPEGPGPAVGSRGGGVAGAGGGGAGVAPGGCAGGRAPPPRSP